MFGLSVGRYAAGEGCARAYSSAADLPGKQRPEPEQLFGVSCKNSSGCQGHTAGTAATQAWDRCPGGLTRTIVVLNPEVQVRLPGTAAQGIHRGHNPNNSSGYKPEQAPKARINSSQVFLLGPPAYITRTSLTPLQVILLVLPHSRYYQLFSWDYLVQVSHLSCVTELFS